jgi:uncharacterized protein YjbJ (UPF0337 family)
MNKDRVAGAVKEAGGKMRAKVGKMTGDEKGEAKGRADQAAGAVQKTYGKIKDAID